MEKSEFYLVSLDKSLIDDSFVEKAFSDYGCEGVQEYSIDEPEIDEILKEEAYRAEDFSKSELDGVEKKLSEGKDKQVFFFSREKEAQAFGSLFEGAVIEKKSKQDWVKEWKKYYEPIVIGDDLIITPPWLSEKKKNELLINPGMGFGTGTHETTYLCLKSYLRYYDPRNAEGATCLDFGCGSGILGLAHIKYGGKEVVLCDIDTLALDNCVENLTLNFSDKNLSGVKVCSRERLDSSHYDLIFANILLSTLFEETPFLLPQLKSSGFIIFSGLLKEQKEEFQSFMKDHFSELREVSTEEKGDWVCLTYQKAG